MTAKCLELLRRKMQHQHKLSLALLLVRKRWGNQLGVSALREVPRRAWGADGLEMTIIYLLLLLSARNVLGAKLDVCGTQTCINHPGLTFCGWVEVKSSRICSSRKGEHLPHGPNMVPEIPPISYCSPRGSLQRWGSGFRRLTTWEESGNRWLKRSTQRFAHDTHFQPLVQPAPGPPVGPAGRAGPWAGGSLPGRPGP